MSGAHDTIFNLNHELIVPSCVQTTKFSLDPGDTTYFYIHALDSGRSVANLNSYILTRALELHDIHNLPMVKRIQSTGDLLVKVATPEQGHKVSNIRQLHDLPVYVTAPIRLNTIRGIVVSAEAKDMTTDEIVHMLSHVGVRKALKITKVVPPHNKVPVVLTFARANIPEQFHLGWEFLQCKIYIPPPLKCHYCQQYGHRLSVCQATDPTCGHCSQLGHRLAACVNAPHCLHCAQDQSLDKEHGPASPHCPRWCKEKEINKLRYESGLSSVRSRGIYDHEPDHEPQDTSG